MKRSSFFHNLSVITILNLGNKWGENKNKCTLKCVIQWKVNFLSIFVVFILKRTIIKLFRKGE